jgi:hypothetical protein
MLPIYGPLLLGGVQIFEYKADLMDAKTIIIDGVSLNQEINLTVYDSTVAHLLEAQA